MIKSSGIFTDIGKFRGKPDWLRTVHQKEIVTTFPDENWDELATSDPEVERVLPTAVGLVVLDLCPSSSNVDEI